MKDQRAKRSVGVVGAYRTAAQRNASGKKLEELIFEAATGALSDARLSMDDIDAVVISTADQAHGRVIESMVSAGAVGAVGRDLTTVPSSGEHAFLYAWLRLLAGQSERVLTVCWGKPSEAVEPRHAEVVAAEPFILRPFGMNMALAAALQASAYMRRFGLDIDDVDRLRARRVEAAKSYYGLHDEWFEDSTEIVAWPLTRRDLPIACDMAAATVLVSEQHAADHEDVAWVDGVGWASVGYDMGSRDLSQFDALRVAAENVIRNHEAVEVLEVEEISSFSGFAAYEALGFAPLGHGISITENSSLTINPSGGNLSVNPGNASGYMRVFEAVQQVRGRAGAVQVKPLPRVATAAALHGFAGQGATVVALNSEPRAA